MDILHHDDWLLAVDKPSGMIVHRGWANDRRTALSVARDMIGRWVYPVHRLDRATSGVLLFALEPAIAARLSEAFATRQMDKRYLALVRGITPPDGVIDHAIAAGEGAERKPACTSYRRLGTFERYSLVEAQPHTGRQHQLRRHFKHISHPIIGDTRYGDGAHNRLFRSRFRLHRLALHAASLRLPHPVSGDWLQLRAPLPADLARPLQAMGITVPPTSGA